tara:strand:+ start:1111 stop:1443 length:333 start_codon:yes stop_codon:yes gene_type:complete
MSLKRDNPFNDNLNDPKRPKFNNNQSILSFKDYQESISSIIGNDLQFNINRLIYSYNDSLNLEIINNRDINLLDVQYKQKLFFIVTTFIDSGYFNQEIINTLCDFFTKFN